MKKTFTFSKQAIKRASFCKKAAYLRVTESRNGDPYVHSATDLVRMEYGRIVRDAVRAEFPGGHAIRAKSHEEAVAKTQDALDAGEAVLFNAAFSHGPLRIRIDILERTAPDHFQVWEVKAGTSVEKYVPDLTVHIFAMRELGFSVDPGMIVLDKQAKWGADTYFRRVDCSQSVHDRLPKIRKRYEELLRALESETPPEVPLKRMCGRCSFLRTCWPSLPERSVFELYQGDGGWEAVDKLIKRGIFDVESLPVSGSYNTIQKRQIRSVREGRAVVAGSPAQSLRRSVTYPLFFLDFESTAPPIPAFVHQRPYDLVPFQWSCHVQRKPGGPIEHHDFLWDREGDPRRELTESLLFLLGSEGTIVVYSDFEERVVRRMGEVFPELRSPLKRVSKRILDLLRVIHRHYYHPDFRGSFSIKNVLPIMVPGIDYSGLGIADGMEAILAYNRLQNEAMTEEERAQLMSDLRAYCELDTLAMVEIFRVLMQPPATLRENPAK